MRGAFVADLAGDGVQRQPGGAPAGYADQVEARLRDACGGRGGGQVTEPPP